MISSLEPYKSSETGNLHNQARMPSNQEIACGNSNIMLTCTPLFLVPHLLKHAALHMPANDFRSQRQCFFKDEDMSLGSCYSPKASRMLAKSSSGSPGSHRGDAPSLLTQAGLSQVRSPTAASIQLGSHQAVDGPSLSFHGFPVCAAGACLPALQTDPAGELRTALNERDGLS